MRPELRAWVSHRLRPQAILTAIDVSDLEVAKKYSLPATSGFAQPKGDIMKRMSFNAMACDLVDQSIQNLFRGLAGGVSEAKPEQSVRTLMYEANLDAIGLDGDVA